MIFTSTPAPPRTAPSTDRRPGWGTGGRDGNGRPGWERAAGTGMGGRDEEGAAGTGTGMQVERPRSPF